MPNDVSSSSKTAILETKLMKKPWTPLKTLIRSETHVNFVKSSTEVKHGGVKQQLGRGVGPGRQALVSGCHPEPEQLAELQGPAQGPQDPQSPQTEAQAPAAPHHWPRAPDSPLSQAGERVRRGGLDRGRGGVEGEEDGVTVEREKFSLKVKFNLVKLLSPPSGPSDNYSSS